MKPVNILIVEDHPIVIEGLQKLFCDNEIINECWIAQNAEICLQTLTVFIPDIILMDIHLPDANGLDLCKTIKENHPEIKILALSSNNESSIIKKMLNNGASGYISKNASENEIILGIKTVLNGKSYLTQELSEKLKSNNDNLPSLTRRELEILKLISDGFTNQGIVEKIFISPLTVDSHRKNLLVKLDIKNTASLIKVAIQKGLLIV